MAILKHTIHWSYSSDQKIAPPSLSFADARLVSDTLSPDVTLDHFLDLGGKVALEETLDMHKDDQHM